MTPSEQKADDLLAMSSRSASTRRIAVYVVSAVVLAVAIWALLNGDERDLWTDPATARGVANTVVVSMFGGT